jgi:hypothetical protein
MGLLMMLATIGGLGLAFILLIIAALTKQVWLSKFILGAVAIWLVFYTTTLLGVSLASREKTLGLNKPKAFCGFYLDCHLHASVSDVRTAKQIDYKTEQGVFYIVKVKIFSDARRAAIGLHNPQFEVVDEQRRIFQPIEDSIVSGNPFERKVPAGGSFEGEVIFDLPADIKNPRLDIAEGIRIDKVIESVLIGDEDSILHKRVRFSLEQSPTQTGLN